MGFPYCKTREDWDDALAKYLYFVDHSLYPIFEQAQPFFAWENSWIDPETVPLAVMHELWNRDNHRTVNVAAAGAAFNFTNIRVPSHFPREANLPSRVVKEFPMRPIIGKTEVAVLLVQFPREIEVPAKPEVSVKPNLTLAMLFGEGAPGEGRNVLDILGQARDEVVRILNIFA